MIDYEEPMAAAFEENFPAARIAGCHFHYAQAVFRKVGSLGLRGLFGSCETFRGWIRSVMALPLLPAGRIRTGAAELLGQKKTALGAVTYRDRSRIRKFESYIQNFWLGRVGPERMSVYSLRHRTNNITESYHRWLKPKLGATAAHPPFWQFMERLTEFIDERHGDFVLLYNGQAVRRKGQRLEHERSVQIRRAEELLDTDQIGELEFLSLARTSLDLRNCAELPVINSENEEMANNDGGGGDVDDDNDDDDRQHHPALGQAGGGGAEKCMLCHEDERDACLQPCSHHPICIGCARERMSEGSGCPRCGQRIDSLIELKN